MSQVKKHLKVGVSLFITALFALNCARSNKTPFAQNLENDAGKAAPTYEEWVALVGQGKTDALYAGIGQDSLNLLTYGIGQSNMVQLINAVTSTNKLITLIGNDSNAGTGPGGRTGLGVVVTLYLILQVDAQMQVNVSSNLPAPGGSTPTDNDTIANLASVVNTLSAAEVQTKMVDLFGTTGAGLGFDLSRSLAAATTETVANQLLYVQRMAKVVAHVSPTASSCAAKLCPLMTGLTAAEVTGKLAPMIKGVTVADKLVETIESTTAVANLITVIQGVTVPNITAKMVVVINNVTDCTKMGYVINSVTSLATLINIINNVQEPLNLGTLVNLAENGSTWVPDGQVSPAETWGTPTKAAPFGTAGSGNGRQYTVAGGTIPVGPITFAAGTGGGTNYLPGTTTASTFGSCTGVQPVIHLNIVGGIIQTTGHYVITAGTVCTNGLVNPVPLTTPASSKTTMARLVDIINGLSPAATYYKLLSLVDGLSAANNGMTKMMRLVQDLRDASDVYDLMNNLTGLVGATCAVANGTDNVSISGGPGSITAGDAKAFIVGNQIAYIWVKAGGAGTGITSATTFSVPGCSGVTYTAQISGGVISTMTVNNAVNNMAQVVELLALTNTPRLEKVLDGQREYDNNGTQGPAATAGTYLNKLGILMTNISQPLEGPLKVGDLLNTVTNPDKIIDLIYQVTTTTNLANIINGIFKSTTPIGCSDSPSSAYTAQGPGANGCVDKNGTVANGSGFFWGERDNAVKTLSYMVENIASVAKLVYIIDNISGPTGYQKVVDLVNHTSTYCQHDDATAHVFPRGAVGLDPLAAGKRLAYLVDNVTSAANMLFLLDNTSSVIKLSKVVSYMKISTPTGQSVQQLPVIINAITGNNCYLATTVIGRGNTTNVAPGGSAACLAQANTNATGMGKMVNVVDFIDGASDDAAVNSLINLISGITDINKLADMINQIPNSSNMVGLLNGVTDARYLSSTTILSTMVNNTPRSQIAKLVGLVGNIGAATGTTTRTFPGPDHVLIAQLMSPYVTANVGTDSGVDVSNMNALLGSLSSTNGSGYTAAPTITAGALNASGGTGALATAVIGTAAPAPSSLDSVTGVTLTGAGTGCTSITGATVGGAGTGATVGLVVAPQSGNNTNVVVKSIYLTNGGSGYGAGATISFTSTGCTTAPTATASVRGLFGWSITNPGSGYTNSFALTAGNITGGGGTGASGTVLVAGPLSVAVPASTLTSIYGGSGYTTGDVCPINGAGGSGATCTVTAASGVLTGCSALTAGSGYIGGQIVSIGGGATVTTTVNAAGNLTAMTVANSGCGYTSVPTVTVLTGTNECATAGAYTAVLTPGPTTGRVTSINVTTQATGCPANPTVVIGETPYAVHGDAATAVVSVLNGGTVIGISMSSPSDNLAQLLTNTEKAPRLKAVNYNGTTTPNISAREAMVRMLYHGVNHTSAGYTGFFGVNNVNYPGIGPAHIGLNVMNNLSGAGSVMTVINLLNNDTTSLTDMVVLIGCGDHVEFAVSLPAVPFATQTINDHNYFCSNHTPTLW
ncbi:MAG: hypothetical protein KF713_08335 [Turneriella sp.]|nr:hypothetical protein [Turneriella sp.]